MPSFLKYILLQWRYFLSYVSSSYFCFSVLKSQLRSYGDHPDMSGKGIHRLFLRDVVQARTDTHGKITTSKLERFRTYGGDGHVLWRQLPYPLGHGDLNKMCRYIWLLPLPCQYVYVWFWVHSRTEKVGHIAAPQLPFVKEYLRWYFEQYFRHGRTPHRTINHLKSCWIACSQERTELHNPTLIQPTVDSYKCAALNHPSKIKLNNFTLWKNTPRWIEQ